MGYTEYKFGNIINSTPSNANAINYNEDNTVSDKIEEIDNKVNTIRSHIGMIIQTTTLDTMEKVIAIYGGTTWTKIEGQFLLGASSTHAVNTTGGEETHTLTTNEMPSHGHGAVNATYMIMQSTNWGYNFGSTDWGNSHPAFANSTGSTGGSQAHNNMPPYKTVYIWERTA